VIGAVDMVLMAPLWGAVFVVSRSPINLKTFVMGMDDRQ
jgi:hypothetical protein